MSVRENVILEAFLTPESGPGHVRGLGSATNSRKTLETTQINVR